MACVVFVRFGQFDGVRSVGSRRANKQSCSTLQGLATRGHRCCGVSTNSGRYGFSPTWFIFGLRAL